MQEQLIMNAQDLCGRQVGDNDIVSTTDVPDELRSIEYLKIHASYVVYRRSVGSKRMDIKPTQPMSIIVLCFFNLQQRGVPVAYVARALE